MITGMHAVIYTRDAEADRAFFRDVLGLPAVDVGGGWLIFAAPPSEVACHPAESNGKHELYLMCDDVKAEIARLGEKGITCGSVTDEGWVSCPPCGFLAAAILASTSRVTQRHTAIDRYAYQGPPTSPTRADCGSITSSARAACASLQRTIHFPLG